MKFQVLAGSVQQTLELDTSETGVVRVLPALNIKNRQQFVLEIGILFDASYTNLR
jgi:hypothetical protein